MSSKDENKKDSGIKGDSMPVFLNRFQNPAME